MPAPAERYGLRRDQIMLVGESFGVRDLIDVYTRARARCDYALHLGLTEAGMGMKGIVASAAGLAPLLLAGNRRHDSREPDANSGWRPHGGSACGQQILQSLGIRSFMPQVTSCPGCGRTTSTYFQELAERIQSYLRADAGVEEAVCRCRGTEARGDGLHR